MDGPAVEDADLADALGKLARRIIGGGSTVADLRRLSGGASKETWAFTIDAGDRGVPLILRRSPPGRPQSETQIPVELEARLMQLAGDAGVPSPPVLHVLQPDDGVGHGFVMRRVEGETLGGRIVRDAAFAAVRPRLARQCGETLARIHALDPGAAPGLQARWAPEQVDRLAAAYHSERWPRPTFALALRWLSEHAPPPGAAPRLLHGDFRNGNLIIGPDGLRAVLDWEVAHLGDPMQDLAWICVNSWRFGAVDLPVGGFGTREDLFAGYEAAGGGRVDPARVHYWEVFGTLRWGWICSSATARFRAGLDRSVERPMIARRTSETEIDLLNLLAPMDEER
jgi:aminoglycoside phosphotransferase (APT) family kinase protein